MPTEFGCIASLPRKQLFAGPTPLEAMPNLSDYCGGARMFVKRDDCTGLAFGGNKVRQLEFYLGDAVAQRADTILITSAVQSNFVRTAAAGARKLGMACHIQLEQRVATDAPRYHDSGNVLVDKLLGATLHSYPNGEDEAGADRQLGEIAADLRKTGHRPYIIPLAPGHPPLGALGYVLAAKEIIDQCKDNDLLINEIVVGSGSGATHSGLLFGLKALGSDIRVTGACVRRAANLQRARIHLTCEGIAALLAIGSPVADEDVRLTDAFLAPGYGELNEPTSRAIVLGAQTEALIIDPVYTGKTLAATIDRAQNADKNLSIMFLHTGGTPAIFAYQEKIEAALKTFATSSRSN